MFDAKSLLRSAIPWLQLELASGDDHNADVDCVIDSSAERFCTDKDAFELEVLFSMLLVWESGSCGDSGSTCTEIEPLPPSKVGRLLFRVTVLSSEIDGTSPPSEVPTAHASPTSAFHQTDDWVAALTPAWGSAIVSLAGRRAVSIRVDEFPISYEGTTFDSASVI